MVTEGSTYTVVFLALAKDAPGNRHVAGTVGSQKVNALKAIERSYRRNTAGPAG